jgi:hypothetical protein
MADYERLVGASVKELKELGYTVFRYVLTEASVKDFERNNPMLLVIDSFPYYGSGFKTNNIRIASMSPHKMCDLKNGKWTLVHLIKMGGQIYCKTLP